MVTDPIASYLEKHAITKMLNGIVNDLVAHMPEHPISFIINSLLSEAAAQGHEVALLRRLQEIKATLLQDEKESKTALASVKQLSEEKSKLEYRVAHLCRTLDRMEKIGSHCGIGSEAGGTAPPADLAAIPPGHTPFSWAAGVELCPSGAVAKGGGDAGEQTELTPERFSPRVAVATLLKASAACEGQSVAVSGWVRTNRTQKKLCFISINDGSSSASLQLVLEKDKLDEAMWEAAKGCGNGSAIRVTGPLKVSPAAGQKWELPVESIEVIGSSDGARYRPQCQAMAILND